MSNFLNAKIPDDTCFAFLSDIHGYSAAFLSALDQTIKMMEESGAERKVIVLGGDYGDHGPDTKGVIQAILDYRRHYPNIEFVCLPGNHDCLAYLTLFDWTIFSTDILTTTAWENHHGAKATFNSYGCKSIRDWYRKMNSEFSEHVEFFSELNKTPFFQIGEILFTHAGVRPHMGWWATQSNLMGMGNMENRSIEAGSIFWIRSRHYKSHSGDLPEGCVPDGVKLVVHGHEVSENCFSYRKGKLSFRPTHLILPDTSQDWRLGMDTGVHKSKNGRGLSVFWRDGNSDHGFIHVDEDAANVTEYKMTQGGTPYDIKKSKALSMPLPGKGVRPAPEHEFVIN